MLPNPCFPLLACALTISALYCSVRVVKEEGRLAQSLSHSLGSVFEVAQIPQQVLGRLPIHARQGKTEQRVNHMQLNWWHLVDWKAVMRDSI